MTSKFIKTLNSMGYMTTFVDVYTQDFLRFCCPGKLVLETGAAFGVATFPILATGANIIVNDLEIKHLEAILDQLEEDAKERVRFAPGLIQELSFDKETFDGIFTSRMLHLLQGEDIEKVLKNFYSWLKPGGVTVITVDTPFLGWFKNNIPNYEKLRERGDKWPGLIKDTTSYMAIAHNIPRFANFLDLPTLERVVKESGFVIKKSSYIKQTSFPEDVQLDGRESAGVIAIKQ